MLKGFSVFQIAQPVENTFFLCMILYIAKNYTTEKKNNWGLGLKDSPVAI